MPDRKDEVLLRVEHLCQYFKENKAVDDVSFDIKKGEVFGLVGESGCGKTTTGRSIIKLYNITSGSIYFKGHRIAAGTRSYKQAIAQARVEMKSAAPERQKELKDFIAAQRAEIRSARHDHQNCDKLYAGELVREVEERYQPLLASAQGEELARLKEHYAYDRRAARKQRYITQIQMIFQDPMASLNERAKVSYIVGEGLQNVRPDLTAAQRTDQVRAKQMIAFLQTHFREKLTLDQVAQAASVSRNTCLSCFRRVLGLSPMEYLTQRRLEYALHLLLTSDLPVAQVAEACGFGDASYFGKRFRKQMGLTPSQYRHRHPATRQPFPANGDL